MNAEFLIPISLFAAVVLILWVYFTNRNKERMAMIDKGTDPKIFKMSRLSTLKWGMFFVGIGVGIFFGSLLEKYTMMDEAGYPAMIFLFGGAGLITYYLIAGKFDKKD